jgi:hypothetical protein
MIWETPETDFLLSIIFNILWVDAFRRYVLFSYLLTICWGIIYVIVAWEVPFPESTTKIELRSAIF